MRDKFDFYSDPAHGWVKVTKKELDELGIADQITDSSYVHGDNVFLEEDADGTLFQRAYEQRFGKKPEYEEHITDRESKIRSYPSYSGV
jgi:hypothetical protein